MKYRPFTAVHLKTIAVLAMLVDHIAATSLISHDTILGMLLRIPGRITAPIMCYMIAEGFHYTSSKQNYLRRLLLFALTSHVPYNLCFGTRFPVTSVMWCLAMGLTALTVVKRDGLRPWIKFGAVCLLCMLSYSANWNFVGVLWIVFFGIYRGDFKKQMLSFCVIGFLFHIIPTFTYLDYGMTHEKMPHWYQLFIFAAVPLLALYNGQKGIGSKWIARAFYWFYPAHLLLIYILNLIWQ